MSVHVISWVLRNSSARLGARLVLIVLADHAQADGTNAWPSVSTIAQEACLSKREVAYALKKLVTDGHIEKTGVSDDQTVIYRIIMGGVQSLQGVQNTSPTPAKFAPEPSLTVPTETSSPTEGTGNGVIRDCVAHYFDTAKKLCVYAPQSNAAVLARKVSEALEAGVSPANVKGGIELLLGKGSPPQSLHYFISEWTARNRRTPREVDKAWRTPHESVPTAEAARLARRQLEKLSGSAPTADGPSAEPESELPAEHTKTSPPGTPSTASAGGADDAGLETP